MSRAQISPISVYKLLPRINCKECGEENCMAYATKLVNREARIDMCSPLLKEENREAYQKLWHMLKPPIKEVKIGTGARSKKVGGKLVIYRHELTWTNPTAIAIDITDEMDDEKLRKRVKEVEDFSFSYIGTNLSLDMIALRSTSNDPDKFYTAAKRLIDSPLPIVLCSLDPKTVERGLVVLGKSSPLIYAATKDNWREMADLALRYKCPLVVFAPNDLGLLRSLTHTLIEYGVSDLVLDPGTFPGEGLADTISNFIALRRAAVKGGDELLGFPLLGVPLTVWMNHEGVVEVAVWNETWLAAMLMNRYADMLIMHSLEGWAQLPLTILRNNLYTDPRKPIAVEPGLKTLGQPSEASPLLLTSNFALTYYTVVSDIESGKVDCYLLVVDSEGLSVESAVAGRKLTSEKVAEALTEYKVDETVKHRKLIIPGRAARLSGEIEEATGWKVIVGPVDSSGIPKFIKEDWPKLAA